MAERKDLRPGAGSSSRTAPHDFVVGKPPGLECPSCGSENCESFAWASNYFSREDVEVPETWVEPEDDPARVAARCARPVFPESSLAWRAADWVLTLGALAITLWLTGSFWLALVPAVAIHVAMFVAWSKLVGRERIREHEARVDAWRQRHLCMDCGFTFAF